MRLKLGLSRLTFLTRVQQARERLETIVEYIKKFDIGRRF